MWIRTNKNTIVFKPDQADDHYFNLNGNFMVGDHDAYADVPTWLANSPTTTTTTAPSTTPSALPDINTDAELSTWLNGQDIKNVVYSWTDADTHIYVNADATQLFKFNGEFAKRESISLVTDPSVKTFINTICDCNSTTTPASVPVVKASTSTPLTKHSTPPKLSLTKPSSSTSAPIFDLDAAAQSDINKIINDNSTDRDDLNKFIEFLKKISPSYYYYYKWIAFKLESGNTTSPISSDLQALFDHNHYVDSTQHTNIKSNIAYIYYFSYWLNKYKTSMPTEESNVYNQTVIANNIKLHSYANTILATIQTAIAASISDTHDATYNVQNPLLNICTQINTAVHIILHPSTLSGMHNSHVPIEIDKIKDILFDPTQYTANYHFNEFKLDKLNITSINEHAQIYASYDVLTKDMNASILKTISLSEYLEIHATVIAVEHLTLYEQIATINDKIATNGKFGIKDIYKLNVCYKMLLNKPTVPPTVTSVDQATFGEIYKDITNIVFVPAKNPAIMVPQIPNEIQTSDSLVTNVVEYTALLYYAFNQENRDLNTEIRDKHNFNTTELDTVIKSMSMKDLQSAINNLPKYNASNPNVRDKWIRIYIISGCYAQLVELNAHLPPSPSSSPIPPSTSSSSVSSSSSSSSSSSPPSSPTSSASSSPIPSSSSSSSPSSVEPQFVIDATAKTDIAKIVAANTSRFSFTPFNSTEFTSFLDQIDPFNYLEITSILQTKVKNQSYTKSPELQSLFKTHNVDINTHTQIKHDIAFIYYYSYWLYKYKTSIKTAESDEYNQADIDANIPTHSYAKTILTKIQAEIKTSIKATHDAIYNVPNPLLKMCIQINANLTIFQTNTMLYIKNILFNPTQHTAEYYYNLNSSQIDAINTLTYVYAACMIVPRDLKADIRKLISRVGSLQINAELIGLDRAALIDKIIKIDNNTAAFSYINKYTIIVCYDLLIKSNPTSPPTLELPEYNKSDYINNIYFEVYPAKPTFVPPADNQHDAIIKEAEDAINDFSLWDMTDNAALAIVNLYYAHYKKQQDPNEFIRQTKKYNTTEVDTIITKSNTTDLRSIIKDASNYIDNNIRSAKSATLWVYVYIAFSCYTKLLNDKIEAANASAASATGGGNKWSRRHRIYHNRTFRH